MMASNCVCGLLRLLPPRADVTYHWESGCHRLQHIATEGVFRILPSQPCEIGLYCMYLDSFHCKQGSSQESKHIILTAFLYSAILALYSYQAFLVVTPNKLIPFTLLAIPD